MCLGRGREAVGETACRSRQGRRGGISFLLQPWAQLSSIAGSIFREAAVRGQDHGMESAGWRCPACPPAPKCHLTAGFNVASLLLYC